jgi:hypothetical protein
VLALAYDNDPTHRCVHSVWCSNRENLTQLPILVGILKTNVVLLSPIFWLLKRTDELSGTRGVRISNE